MLTRVVAFFCRFPPVRQILWRNLYDFLADRYRESDWTFMNYGYVSLPETDTLPLDASDEPNRYCIQLYHFIASGSGLQGKRVLEVGSGRGGGASYVKRYLGPAEVTGVDFSANAVTFCRQKHRVQGLSFREGSAEALPFEDASFDAVVNVESSHCYGSMEAFLSEVRRVLRPGGLFLHADLRYGKDLSEWKAQLNNSRMKMVSETEITANVLAALDRDNDRKAALISKLVPKPFVAAFSDFAGMRGSIIYEGFRTGGYTYWAFVMENPPLQRT